MKIHVVVDVPDGDICTGCELWYRAEDKKCYCLLFGFIELNRRYKKNAAIGTEIVKCAECMKCIEEGEGEC